MQNAGVSIHKMAQGFLSLGQSWHISAAYGAKALADLHFQFMAMSSGVPYDKLAIARNRDTESKSTLVTAPQGGKVAVMQLSGVMRLKDGLCSTGIKSKAAELRRLSADPSISAIVVEADTGGGEALAGQEFMNAVEASPKPVVFSAHYLGSAGVMAALPADAIYAAGEQSEIGSVGVMATIDTEFLNWYKGTFVDVYADTSQNKNEEFRALKEGDYGPLIQSLNKADDIFMRQVSQYRQLKGTESQRRDTLSGRMFFASDALRRGLIDGIATKEQAIAEAEKLSLKYKRTGKRPSRKNAEKDMFSGIFQKIGWQKEAEAAGTNEEAITQALQERQAEFDGLAEKMKALAADVETIKAENAEKSGKIQALESQVSELTDKNKALQQEADEMKAKLEETNGKLAALESQNKALEEENARLKSENDEANKQLADMKLSKTATKFMSAATDALELEKRAGKFFSVNLTEK